ncbi:cellulose biosynthesis cyclic di-GMP-binding regulatory protein BcsB [Sphaerothrix gracilis]|uniref:cellulose biosynthesis cyclic di-GMP-binding regulatory protein BcsB n=1 Tax=Sphaerothrix gracilis TaxID=3151835 RepID=UPI0031FD57F9
MLNPFGNFAMFLYRPLQLGFVTSCLLLQASLLAASTQAQSATDSNADVPAQPETLIESLPLPVAPAEPPIVAAAPAGQYVLEFNRSPVVEERLRFEGIYDEARLWFTRPRNWQAQTIKVLLRYRHSAALYATRSNMTVLVNGTSIGSVPLNRKQGELGEAIFEIPARLIRDYNEVVVAALQNNSPTCTQDPFDPSLWSEVLPDSKLVFDFEPQPIPLDFEQYPYPLVDTLSLEPNKIAYLKPSTVAETWLTAASRLHSSLGRTVDYRPLETRLVDELGKLEADERLVVIGTLAEQPALADLALPLPLKADKFLDGEGQPLPDDIGVLVLTTALEQQVPVLVATGNGAAGVAKAAQFLVHSEAASIATGQAILVQQLAEAPSPEPRRWPKYLPTEPSFELQELTTFNQKTFEDVTVWGSQAPALEFDFRALPDDQFLPGSFMRLSYSYGPQVNPLTSQVEVTIDGVAVGGERLRSEDGGYKESIKLNLPTELIQPHSKMQVNFRLDPRERRSCSRVTDQQLWGTIHGDTQFQLAREVAAWLPDLKLLQYGFPFAAPQDLSQTAIVLPNQPSNRDLAVMLEVSERLGRLSQAKSVQLSAYRADQLDPTTQQTQHLIAIGTEDNFPLPEAFEQSGFQLGSALLRQWQQSQIQPLSDEEGLVKQMRSPWNSQRMLLALSGQTETGLDHVQQLFNRDALFYQLEGDTVLIRATGADVEIYDPAAYSLTVLRQASQQRTSLEKSPRQLWVRLQRHWLFLAAGTIATALVFYGIAQQLLKRLSQPDA